MRLFTATWIKDSEFTNLINLQTLSNLHRFHDSPTFHKNDFVMWNIFIIWDYFSWYVADCKSFLVTESLISFANHRTFIDVNMRVFMHEVSRNKTGKLPWIIYVCLSDPSKPRDETSSLKFSISRRAKIQGRRCLLCCSLFVEYIGIEFNESSHTSIHKFCKFYKEKCDKKSGGSDVTFSKKQLRWLILN